MTHRRATDRMSQANHRRRPALVLAVAVALLLSSGCSVVGSVFGGDTVRVLAGSELRDVEPLLEQIRDATGVNLEFEYIGTLDGADRIARGAAGTELAWFSHTKYLELLTASNGENPVAASTPIMLSPVVLGVKRSVAERFGWTGGAEVTWADVAERAAAGELRYGMSNPAASNSGFSALTGVAAAFAGTGSALETEDIDAERLTSFFSGQALTSGSSGWLADAFVADQGSLDGLINYESVLLELNDSGQLDEPLELIYPSEGIITADYPLQLLDRDRREEYDALVEYLRRPEVQEQLMRTTSRRPAVPGVEPDARFGDQELVELPFPGRLDVVDDLLFAYLDEFSRPAHAVFVLDVSGSMEGDRLESLKQALHNLTGADTSLAGRFTRFRERERVTIIPFDGSVREVREFTVDATAPDSGSLAEVRGYIDELVAFGGTAIFSALDVAYETAAADQPDEWYTSVVVMTDGENNGGIPVEELLSSIWAAQEHGGSVRTFAIQFGEADRDELERVTEATGGAVFGGRGSLTDAFREIRGYQ